MSRAIKRIQKGFEKIISFHSYNVIKGARKILKEGKDFGTNFYQSMEKLIVDGLEDIDNRLNRKTTDEIDDDQVEDDDEFDTNVLTDFCFGEIYGPNYGIRTFLEFEEECDEGSTCSEDIDSDSAIDQNLDIDTTSADVKRNFHFSYKGNYFLFIGKFVKTFTPNFIFYLKRIKFV